MVDTESGELIERRLEHGNGEAKRFYAELHPPGRVGMESPLGVTIDCNESNALIQKDLYQ